MPTSSTRPDRRRTSLRKIGQTSLDQLSGADVSVIVQKVVEARLDQARISAAKFSSAI